MHRGHGEGLEAERASQADRPVQQATRHNEPEDGNRGVPGTSESVGTHEVRDVIAKVEGECQ